MKQELKEQLMKEFPNLFPEVPFCGFGCGNGWFDIIKDLCQKLEEMIIAFPENERFKYRCVQIKEKFGGLRFYLDHTPKEMWEFIDKAEEKSLKTCENCGAVGKQTGKGWIKTLCEDCSKTNLRDI